MPSRQKAVTGATEGSLRWAIDGCYPAVGVETVFR